MKKKAIIIVLALALVVGCAIGGTIAWLTAETDPVVNTFTVGDINITLTETERTYQMVPGNIIAKDPKVTVLAGSEACWLFVKVEKSTDPDLDAYITYTMADRWTALEGQTGVFYREVEAAAANVPFDVISGNQVTVKETVTKEMMKALEDSKKYPTLTFTAYACQKDNIPDVATAWAKVSEAAVTP